MKKLEIKQMEEIQGGTGPQRPPLNPQCGASLAGALVFGMGGLIAASTGGVGAIAFAMAANYWGWGMAAWSCS